MRIKLKDIAEHANVSTATVSRVLNNSSNVDKQTRDLVLQALQKIGYPLPEIRKEPEVAKSITIVASDPTGHGVSYMDLMMAGIDAIGRQRGYQVNMQRILLENPVEEELETLAQAESVILVGGAVQPCIFDTLERAKVPFVLAAAHQDEREINCVHGDYRLGATQAVHALARLGHQRIALINGPTLSTSSRDKLAGYRLGLAEVGLAQDQALVLSGEEFHPAEGQRLTRQLLDLTRDFSAIIYATDSMALGGISALKEVELVVPNDVSIIGFYDEAFAPFTDPPLSSININWQRVGEIAALRIIALLEQRDNQRLHITIPVTLILRGSTRSVE